MYSWGNDCTVVTQTRGEKSVRINKKNMLTQMIPGTAAVFVLTHWPESRDEKNWIRTSANYKRICL